MSIPNIPVIPRTYISEPTNTNHIPVGSPVIDLGSPPENTVVVGAGVATTAATAAAPASSFMAFLSQYKWPIIIFVLLVLAGLAFAYWYYEDDSQDDRSPRSSKDHPRGRSSPSKSRPETKEQSRAPPPASTTLTEEERAQRAKKYAEMLSRGKAAAQNQSQKPPSGASSGNSSGVSSGAPPTKSQPSTDTPKVQEIEYNSGESGDESGNESGSDSGSGSHHDPTADGDVGATLDDDLLTRSAAPAQPPRCGAPTTSGGQCKKKVAPGQKCSQHQ